ncbi:CHRD domain-containing protein [Streptomyces lincolnensis]|uniref:CHRD domain-containing protein n=1 Tax=Streptomyces lincolnensis TaxID=1915 RepID=UPI001E59EEEC|nr:CHRD domain-containing protein [Streptomyces lincolnensis]MCD7444381.1 CHRD domain-containing protein [Streptomyces lincolnensis]
MGMNTFSMRRQSLLVTAVAVAAVGGVATATVPAAATDTPGGKEATVLAASLRGANEVPVAGGPAVGDRDGAALQFVKVGGDKVSVAVKWAGTGRPTALHIHEGVRGANGGIKVDFTDLLGKSKRKSVTGTVKVADAALLDRLKANPTSFYANLHTAEFPGGAVRGQLHKVTVAAFDFRDALHNFQASVLKGKQIYECKPATGGGFAFAQRDVSAVLAGRIAHSFVAPNSGTPQWIARDGSAVTGAVISRTPNGEKNIPELDLRATQSGKHHGLLADTTEILRLNTVGGVAPAGSCASGTIVGVPYQADYVFLRG